MISGKRKSNKSFNAISSYFKPVFTASQIHSSNNDSISKKLKNTDDKGDHHSQDLENSSCTKITVPSKINCNFSDIKWNIISKEDLNLKYARIFSNTESDEIFERLEREIKYFSGDLLKVKVFGKIHNIPRKQVSYGDTGLSYSFSGISIPAVPWNECSVVLELKQCVEAVIGDTFNFVLINRYKDGNDHMGEHRDDEKDLVPEAPIASLSFGQKRDFIFKHKDSRGKNAVKDIPPLKLELEHGSLLLMERPTNKFWYHSLPVRKHALNVRVNLTFRKMVIK